MKYIATELVVGAAITLPTGRVEEYVADSLMSALEACKATHPGSTTDTRIFVVFKGDLRYSVRAV